MKNKNEIGLIETIKTLVLDPEMKKTGYRLMGIRLLFSIFIPILWIIKKFINAALYFFSYIFGFHENAKRDKAKRKKQLEEKEKQRQIDSQFAYLYHEIRKNRWW